MISVAVVARDAASTLPQCLESILPVSDDIVVVVDNRTQDNTAVIAQKYKARVFFRRFDDFASQKNYALSQTIHNWVFALDADEQLSPELSQEISNLKFQSSNYSAYTIPRQNYIFGRSMHHTNWSPKDDTHVWLFDKTTAHWEGAVHEQVIVTGRIGNLSSPKIHYNYKTVEDFLIKMNQYTSLERPKLRLSLLPIYPLWKFFRHYFMYLGFLDGWHGLFLSYLQAIYGLCVFVKSWQRTKYSS